MAQRLDLLNKGYGVHVDGDDLVVDDESLMDPQAHLAKQGQKAQVVSAPMSEEPTPAVTKPALETPNG